LFLAMCSKVWRPTSSRLKPVPQVGVHPIPLDARDAFSGTGFSREEAGEYAIIFAVWQPTSSRLKPVPLINHYAGALVRIRWSKALSDALAPSPTAITICLYGTVVTSPAAKMPGMDVSPR
jgi:hypothetical protein